MQHSYQVPWTRLESACISLKRDAVGEDGFHRLLPILFLCGLRFQVSYFEASQSANSRLKQAGAGHLPDDCLNEVCIVGLQKLMRIAKSRKLQATLSELLQRSSNSEWLILSVAFIELLDGLPSTVRRWVDHGDREKNMVRFSFGMGVRSAWAEESRSFVRKMAKKPFGFVNPNGEPCSSQVRAIIDNFVWNTDWTVQED